MDDKTKKFLQKLRDNGNWSENYDYSKAEYVNNKSIIIVTDKRFNTEHLIPADMLLHGTKCCGSNLKHGYLSFEDARNFVWSLNLKKKTDWEEYCKTDKKSHLIPTGVRDFYRDNGWISWSDWIGTKPGFNSNYLSFDEARKFVRTLELKNQVEWKKYCEGGNKPHNIPTNIETYYKGKGWLSLADFLGTRPGFDGSYLPFHEARTLVRSLKLSNITAWNKYKSSEEKPYNIPYSPNETYKDKGWVSFNDWLGNNNKPTHLREYLSFEEARKIVRSLNFQKQKDWNLYCSSGKPDNIPSSPQTVYKTEWLSLADWLGTRPGFRGFLLIEEAKKIVWELNLKTQEEWIIYCKSGLKPDNIPANPHTVYKKTGWLSLADWLGTRPGFDGAFLPFEDARKFVHGLGLKNQNEWFEYCKSGNKPDNIPYGPSEKYKNEGYVSFGDWLGNGNIRDKEFVSFEECKLFVQKLGLKSQGEWFVYCKSGLKPNNIPANPDRVYQKHAK